jgi:hypothetical protein
MLAAPVLLAYLNKLRSNGVEVVLGSLGTVALLGACPGQYPHRLTCVQAG